MSIFSYLYLILITVSPLDPTLNLASTGIPKEFKSAPISIAKLLLSLISNSSTLFSLPERIISLMFSMSLLEVKFAEAITC